MNNFIKECFTNTFTLASINLKDQCDVCLEYQNAFYKITLKEKYELHIKNKNETKKLKTEVKELAMKYLSFLVAAFHP